MGTPLRVLLLLALATVPAASRGQVWQRIGPATGLPCTIVASPAAPQVLYAGFERGGVFRSDDGGRSWSFAGRGLGASGACKLVADAVRAGVVVALTPERVLRTADAGRTWVLPEVAPRTTFHGHHHPRLAVGGADPAIYVAGAGGIFRSDDSGRTWSRRDRGLPAGRAEDLAAEPSSTTLYAVSAGQLFRTTNGGRRWDRVAGPAGLRRVEAAPGSLFVIGDQVWRSRDGGRRWKRVHTGPARDLWADTGRSRLYLVPAPDFASGTLLISEDDGDTWRPADSAPRGVAEIEFTPRSLSAITMDGIWRSADADAWTRVAGRFPTGSYDSVVAAPSDASVLYAGSYAGLWRGQGRPGSWRRLEQGPRYPTGSLVVMPGESPRLMAGGEGGVYISGDAGETWTRHTFPEGPRECIAARSLGVGGPPAASVLYAWGGVPETCGSIPGICNTLASRDGGATWHCILDDGRFLIAPAGVDPATGALFAFRFAQPRPLALWRTDDDGVTWTPTTGSEDVTTMTFAPTTDIVYAGTTTGFVRSDDRGLTWYDLPFPVARPVTAVAVDPREPATVYAATRPAAVYRSRDGGLSWRRVGGDIGELHVTALLVDPSDGTVFAATYGGGILRLRQRD